MNFLFSSFSLFFFFFTFSVIPSSRTQIRNCLFSCVKDSIIHNFCLFSFCNSNTHIHRFFCCCRLLFPVKFAGRRTRFHGNYPCTSRSSMQFNQLAAFLTQQNVILQQNRVRTANRSAHLRQSSPAATLPQALPCLDFYERFPNRVGAIGNVVITVEEELKPWLLVVRPVSRKEAEKHGSCIIFKPSQAKKSRDAQAPATALYFRITDTDDMVYGRAAYIARNS